MTKYTLPIKHAAAVAALCLLQVASAGATVEDATVSLSVPNDVFVGVPFSIGVDLQLPQGSAPGGVYYVTAQVFYFAGSTPTGSPLMLNDITAGALLNPTDYFFSPNVGSNPYDGVFQAAAFLNEGGTLLMAPASGRLMDLSFTYAAGADGIGSTHTIEVAIGLYDSSVLPFPVTPNPVTTSVTMLQPGIAVPEASTAVLIAGGLLLVVFGRRKLKFSPH
jgi:hypothetical protein